MRTPPPTLAQVRENRVAVKTLKRLLRYQQKDYTAAAQGNEKAEHNFSIRKAYANLVSAGIEGNSAIPST